MAGDNPSLTLLQRKSKPWIRDLNQPALVKGSLPIAGSWSEMVWKVPPNPGDLQQGVDEQDTALAPPSQPGELLLFLAAPESGRILGSAGSAGGGTHLCYKYLSSARAGLGVSKTFQHTLSHTRPLAEVEHLLIFKPALLNLGAWSGVATGWPSWMAVTTGFVAYLELQGMLPSALTLLKNKKYSKAVYMGINIPTSHLPLI